MNGKLGIEIVSTAAGPTYCMSRLADESASRAAAANMCCVFVKMAVLVDVSCQCTYLQAQAAPVDAGGAAAIRRKCLALAAVGGATRGRPAVCRQLYLYRHQARSSGVCLNFFRGNPVANAEEAGMFSGSKVQEESHPYTPSPKRRSCSSPQEPHAKPMAVMSGWVPQARTTVPITVTSLPAGMNDLLGTWSLPQGFNCKVLVMSGCVPEPAPPCLSPSPACLKEPMTEQTGDGGAGFRTMRRNQIASSHTGKV